MTVLLALDELTNARRDSLAFVASSALMVGTVEGVKALAAHGVLTRRLTRKLMSVSKFVEVKASRACCSGPADGWLIWRQTPAAEDRAHPA